MNCCPTCKRPYEEQFNLFTGIQLKDEALKALDIKYEAEVLLCRSLAFDLLRRRESISVDDVRLAYEEHRDRPGGVYAAWGKWAGSIFRTGFRKVGTTITTVASSHARPVTLWALDEGGSDA